MLSDDDAASDRIEEFAAGRQRWMVAVRMVSEGVDVPAARRRRVRHVARRRRCSSRRPSAASCGPGGAARRRPSSCRRCRCSSGWPRSWRSSATTPSTGPPRRGRRTWTPGGRAAGRGRTGRRTASGRARRAPASRRSRRRRRSTGCCSTARSSAPRPPSGSDEEQDFLGIPGLLEPDQVTTLLRQRQADQLAARSKQAGREGRPPTGRRSCPVAAHREVTALRKELHSLVGAWARRTSQPHATVHAGAAAELRRPRGAEGVRRPAARPDRDPARLVRRQALTPPRAAPWPASEGRSSSVRRSRPRLPYGPASSVAAPVPSRRPPTGSSPRSGPR